jgi:hypothetical protein
MRMCSSRGDLCAGSLGTLFEYRRCILNGATFRARAWQLQLKSLSKCRSYILNTALMLRTSGCTRYTLKDAFRLNMRTVSPQSHPCCMKNQPTCLRRVLHGVLLRTSAIQRLLAPRALSDLPLLSTFSNLLPLGKPGEKSLRPTLLPADSCRTA